MQKSLNKQSVNKKDNSVPNKNTKKTSAKQTVGTENTEDAAPSELVTPSVAAPKPAVKPASKPSTKQSNMPKLPTGLSFNASDNLIFDSKGEVWADLERGFEGLPTSPYGNQQRENLNLLGRLAQSASNQQ